MSSSSNPGAATPQSLHKLYKHQGAVTANPYTLRQFASSLPTQTWQAGAGASEPVLGVAMLGLLGLSGAAWWRDAAARRKWVGWRGRAAFATVGNSGASRLYTWNLHDALQPAHAQLWVVP